MRNEARENIIRQVGRELGNVYISRSCFLFFAVPLSTFGNSERKTDYNLKGQNKVVVQSV